MRWLFQTLTLSAMLPTMLLCDSNAAFAVDFFRARSGHSLNAVFGLPTPLPAAKLSISGTYGNMFAGGETADELLLLDGERAELRLSIYRRIATCSGIGLDLPVIAHAEGYFDSAIESWHDLFNLPNGNRDESEQSQLSILYNNTTASSNQSLTSSSASVGDIHLQYIHRASCHALANFLPRFSYRVGVKLPTGDKKLLTGSGAADAYMDMTTLEKRLARRMAIRGALGLLWIGDTDLFSNEMSLVAYGSAILGYRYSSLVELKLQLDWHSRMFDSELTELGDFAAQAAFGATWRLQNGSIDFAIQEDVVPDTAPDINIYLSWQRNF